MKSSPEQLQQQSVIKRLFRGRRGNATKAGKKGETERPNEAGPKTDKSNHRHLKQQEHNAEVLNSRSVSASEKNENQYISQQEDTANPDEGATAPKDYSLGMNEQEKDTTKNTKNDNKQDTKTAILFVSTPDSKNSSINSPLKPKKLRMTLSLEGTVRLAEQDLNTSLDFLLKQHHTKTLDDTASQVSEDPSHRIQDLQRSLRQADQEWMRRHRLKDQLAVASSSSFSPNRRPVRALVDNDSISNSNSNNNKPVVSAVSTSHSSLPPTSPRRCRDFAAKVVLHPKTAAKEEGTNAAPGVGQVNSNKLFTENGHERNDSKTEFKTAETGSAKQDVSEEDKQTPVRQDAAVVLPRQQAISENDKRSRAKEDLIQNLHGFRRSLQQKGNLDSFLSENGSVGGRSLPKKVRESLSYESNYSKKTNPSAGETISDPVVHLKAAPSGEEVSVLTWGDGSGVHSSLLKQQQDSWGEDDAESLLDEVFEDVASQFSAGRTKSSHCRTTRHCRSLSNASSSLCDAAGGTGEGSKKCWRPSGLVSPTTAASAELSPSPRSGGGQRCHRRLASNSTTCSSVGSRYSQHSSPTAAAGPVSPCSAPKSRESEGLGIPGEKVLLGSENDNYVAKQYTPPRRSCETETSSNKKVSSSPTSTNLEQPKPLKSIVPVPQTESPPGTDPIVAPPKIWRSNSEVHLTAPSSICTARSSCLSRPSDHFHNEFDSGYPPSISLQSDQHPAKADIGWVSTKETIKSTNSAFDLVREQKHAAELPEPIRVALMPEPIVMVLQQQQEQQQPHQQQDQGMEVVEVANGVATATILPHSPLRSRQQDETGIGNAASPPGVPQPTGTRSWRIVGPAVIHENENSSGPRLPQPQDSLSETAVASYIQSQHQEQEMKTCESFHDKEPLLYPRAMDVSPAVSGGSTRFMISLPGAYFTNWFLARSLWGSGTETAVDMSVPLMTKSSGSNSSSSNDDMSRRLDNFERMLQQVQDRRGGFPVLDNPPAAAGAGSAALLPLHSTENKEPVERTKDAAAAAATVSGGGDENASHAFSAVWWLWSGLSLATRTDAKREDRASDNPVACFTCNPFLT